MTITVEGAPRGKGRPRSRIAKGKGGRAFVQMYTPVETRNYEAYIKYCAREAMQGHALLEGPVRLAVVAYLAVPQSWSKKRTGLALEGKIRPTKKPDIDNVNKTMDALNGIVWRDDAQVVSLYAGKFYSAQPRVELIVEPLDIGGA